MMIPNTLRDFGYYPIVCRRSMLRKQLEGRKATQMSAEGQV